VYAIQLEVNDLRIRRRSFGIGDWLTAEGDWECEDRHPKQPPKPGPHSAVNKSKARACS